MSLVSAANVAIARRTVFGPSIAADRHGLASAADASTPTGLRGGPAPDNAVTAAVKVVTTFIPTEMLTLYLTYLAVLQPLKPGEALPSPTDGLLAGVKWGYGAALLLTPIVLWLVYAAKRRAADLPLPWSFDMWPFGEMMLASVCFAAWAAALPLNPFLKTWFTPAIGGFTVVLAATFVGLIAPLVLKRLESAENADDDVVPDPRTAAHTARSSMHRTDRRSRENTSPPGVNACGNWASWHDFMPGSRPTLYVVGQCTFPTPGYSVVLRRVVPQGINPAILILERVVTPPAGPTPDRIDTVDVRFEEQTDTRYSQVHIVPDRVTVDVEIVQ